MTPPHVPGTARVRASGFHGALGHNNYVDTDEPKTLCLGYAPVVVGVLVESRWLEWTVCQRSAIVQAERDNSRDAGAAQDSDVMEEEITAAVVACGSDHTATISRRGQLFTWGLGNSGELGQEQVRLAW